MKRPARDLVREATMRRQYEGGLTLRQVGEQHDLTYERVRQILRRAKVPMRSRGRQTPPVFGPAPKEGEGGND